MNRAINLRFRSPGCLSTTSPISPPIRPFSGVKRWVKRWPVQNPSRRPWFRAQNVSVFVPPLHVAISLSVGPVSNGRQFIVAYCSDCSLIPFQFSPIRSYNTSFRSSNCSLTERKRGRATQLFFPIRIFQFFRLPGFSSRRGRRGLLGRLVKRIENVLGNEINRRNSSRFKSGRDVSPLFSWTNSLVGALGRIWSRMETVRSVTMLVERAFSSRSNVHLHVELDLLMAARSRWF